MHIDASPTSADEWQDIEEPATREIGIQCNIDSDLRSKVNCGVQTYVPLHERFSPGIDHERNENPCLGNVTFKCPVNSENIHIVKCDSVINNSESQLKKKM